VPEVQDADGRAYGEEGEECREFVLGMRTVSQMSADGGDGVRMDHLNYAFLLGAMLVALPASAITPVQTILTDRPCDAPLPGDLVSTTSPNGEVTKSISALPAVVGDWQGQTQFQAGMNGVRVAEAQSVVPLVLTFSADGKVTGSSPDNGCKVLGVWSPGTTPRLFMLDVSLNSCGYSKFNQWYSGSLIATSGKNGSVVAGREYITDSGTGDLALRCRGDVEAVITAPSSNSEKNK
jgi:hypothetical protein